MKPSTNSANGSGGSNKGQTHSSSSGSSKSSSKKQNSSSKSSSSNSTSKSKKSAVPVVISASFNSNQQQQQQVVTLSAGSGQSNVANSQSATTTTENGTGSSSSAHVSGSGGGSSSKDKSQYKNFAGFHANSIKVMWDQYNNNIQSKSDTETEKVQPDVLTRLAEDATYKVWELCNTLKTYSRHSGGVVGVDTVNEVLKDSDVPAVIGAGATQWDHEVDYEGTYYFPSDETLELRDEYLKEVNAIQSGPLKLASGWKMDKKASVDLNAFCKALCIAIISGDEETFEYATHIALISSNVACVIRSILRFSLKMIMFEYTVDTLDRVLQLLSAIIRNPHTRDCTTQDNQLYHLCQLMMCLVLGPIDLNIAMADLKRDLLELKQREYEIDSIAKELQLSVKQEPSSVPNNSLYPAMDVDDIQNECEALLQMMESEGFEPPPVQDPNDYRSSKIKTSPTPTLSIISYPKEEGIIKQENNDLMKTTDKSSIKEENITATTYYADEFVYHPNTDTSSSFAQTPKLHDDEGSTNQHMPGGDGTNADGTQSELDLAVEAEPECFSTMVTTRCSDDMLDQVLTVIGSLAAKWGYFEGELVYLVQKRLEQFFLLVTETTVLDYDWIVRTVRLVWTLGDFAFREMTAYFDKIDTLQTPEWIQCYFNATAIFMRGRDDIFLYEYLYDLCGDGLAPFMVYYTKYSERHARRLRRNRLKSNTAALSVPPRLVLHSYDHPAATSQQQRPVRPQLAHMFPDYVQANHSPHIEFAFDGCKPVVRANKTKKTNSNQSYLVSGGDTNVFSNKVVVCRRRLMRRLLNAKENRAATYELRQLFI